MKSLAGQVALVTGAGSGIGAATARLLAANGAELYAGDLTVSHDVDPVVPGPDESRITRLRLDVREEPDWEQVVSTVLEREGRLDILVHAAGISAAAPLEETTLEDWRKVLATNLDGTFLAIKHGMGAMRDSGGAIVVIGSASGIRPSAGAAAYSTSKAGVAMLVRSAAKECNERKLPIRINAVSPAGVRTPMWLTMPFFQDLIRQHGSAEAAFAALEADGGGRFITPEEVAGTVLFLVSDAARHVTGIQLPVDSGYTL